MLLLCAAKICMAQPTLQLVPLISNLSKPVDIVNAGDKSNRLFIAEKTGKIRVYKKGKLLAKPFLDLHDSINAVGVHGLLSIAFHPNYINNHYFFVYYTSKTGTLTLARFSTNTSNADTALKSSGVILIAISQPTDSLVEHNGGKLNFGKDGYLYLSIGDGSSEGGDAANFAQNKSSLFGKIIRIDVNNFSVAPYYTIPTDNPFVNDDTARKEIWMLGLRNPWRWSFDSKNGDTWIADVGQDSTEEINYKKFSISGGDNYGWRCYEGNSIYNNSGCASAKKYSFPVFEYYHNSGIGGYCITGGYVYRGKNFPAMQNYYICIDYISGNAWKIKKTGSTLQVYAQQNLLTNITGFGEDEKLELYATCINGNVYKVQAASAFESSTLIAEAENNNNNFVFPTIVNNHIINIFSKPFTQLNIFSITGKKVFAKKFSSYTSPTKINLPQLSSGVYVVEVAGANTDLKQKIFLAN